MIGKGSVSHNSRKFNAKNTDPERTQLNISYCNEKIQNVYRELFDEALKRYNDKQTRADRKIDCYYERIRRGKQEKPFHEVIFQIGNRDDTGVGTDAGEIAAKALDEFYQGFPERNPNLRVFSAHLHMDESTPHLHIDFVPFTTGSKRGLDTRVSLKQALAAQGFKGEGKHDNEWNRWVQSEKEELAAVMEKYGILWEQKGTHYEHLTDYEYKRQQRALEVEQLTKKAEQLEESLHYKQNEYESLDKRIQSLEKGIGNIYELKRELNTSLEYELQEPQGIITAKNYKVKFAEPLIKKLKKLLTSVMAKYLSARDEIEKLTRSAENLRRENARLVSSNQWLTKQNAQLREDNKLLREEAKDHTLLSKVFGEEVMQRMLEEAHRMQTEKRKKHEKTNGR